MKTLTNIVEGKGSVELLQAEIQRYLRAMNPKLPKRVQAVNFILSKYPQINTKDMILDIRDGKFRLFDKLDIIPEDLKELQKLLKKLDSDIKLLPQFLTAHQRQALEDGKLATNDVTMDLETPKGQDAVAKQYAPLVFKLANQFVGKSGLDRAELISAGMMGLANAINTYRKPEQMEMNGGHNTSTTFLQYASYMIRFQILSDMDEYSRSLSVSAYMQKKAEEREENITFQNIDAKYGKDEDGDDIKIDRILDLSNPSDAEAALKAEDIKKGWNNLYSMLEKQFSQRDCNIFYRFCGINGFKKEKGKDIAKELNLDPSTVTWTFNKMLKWITKNPEALDTARMLQSLYVESRFCELYRLDKSMIIESLRNDEVFVLLESVMKWSDPKGFTDAVNHATDMLSVEDAAIVYNCIIKGESEIDANYRKNKKAIIAFLNELYPTESFKKSSDLELKDALLSLHSSYVNLKLDWYKK